MATQGEKRNIDELENEEDDDEWIGPLPLEAAKPKKKKGLSFVEDFVTF